ncbi:LytR/AlgR family response regulator transcription factor [Aquimarina rubra]|uniref:LytR/AlgR family response regulator transcription factor n=1 Tax=Aquimarina rubra TaxID=1920033 RepID=A0ABW5LA96_9FLAO
MLAFFKKPHPFIFNVYSVLIPVIITFFIIVVLQPFQFQDFGTTYLLISGSMVSILVGLSIVGSVKMLQKIFPKAMAENKWTVGKEFLLFLFVLILLIVVMSLTLLILNPRASAVALMARTSAITFAISIFPILISIMFEQYRHQKKQLQKATSLTKVLKSKNTELLARTSDQIPVAPPVMIPSEKGEIELRLDPKDLVYIKSDGNYIEVFFTDRDQVHKKLIRNRLKHIEELLPPITFLRCHNSYIVNGNHIIEIQGNARNLMLRLKGITETVPVSRAKAPMISDFLHHLK